MEIDDAAEQVALDPAIDPGAIEGAAQRRPTLRERVAALLEIILCSGFPTQLTLIVILALLGISPAGSDGRLSLSYIVILTMADAALVLALIWWLLRAHGENPLSMLVGTRPAAREAVLGLLLVPAALLLASVAFVIMQQVAPGLHNVPENPLEALIVSPGAAVAFALVAVLAGGVREEVQRAFILRRFERHLGGAVVGLVVFSVVFGLGHLVQGWDAAIVTGLLGAMWGICYLVRGSVIGPVVCHAGFNLTEVLIAFSVNGG